MSFLWTKRNFSRVGIIFIRRPICIEHADLKAESGAAQIRGTEKPFKTHLRTWLVQTITGCWLFSMLSLTWRTQCTHSQSPHRFCIRRSKIHDLSCSDWVTRQQIKIIEEEFSSKMTYLIDVCSVPPSCTPNAIAGTKKPPGALVEEIPDGTRHWKHKGSRVRHGAKMSHLHQLMEYLIKVFLLLVPTPEPSGSRHVSKNYGLFWTWWFRDK